MSMFNGQAVAIAPEIENWDSIVDKTVFVLISFSRFGNSKKVRNMAVNTDADTTRFNHNKKLLESKELQAIVKSDNACRLLVDAYCIPYAEGVRICPWKNIPKVRGILTDYLGVTRPELVDVAADVYEDQVNAAKEALKEHFNPLDYPTKDGFKASYKANFQIKTFATPDKLQSLDPSFFEDEQKKAKEMYQSAVVEFTTNLRVAAFDMVNEFMDKLTDNSEGKKKILRPERLDAIKKFVEGFDALNIAADKGLADQIMKLNALTEGVDVEKLRENEGFKLEFKAKMAEVQSALGTLVEVKGRKFRD